MYDWTAYCGGSDNIDIRIDVTGVEWSIQKVMNGWELKKL